MIQEKKSVEQSKKLLPEEAQNAIKKLFSGLHATVTIEVYTNNDSRNQYNEVTKGFVQELAELSDKIQPLFLSLDSAQAKEQQITASPTVLIAPDKYRLRYTGAPIGEEGQSFITAILLASAGSAGLSKTSQHFLEKVADNKHIMIFVTPMCPYCPGQVLNAFRAAITRPDIISAECVEAQENMQLASLYNVGAVPHTVVNRELLGKGLMPEEQFMAALAGEPYEPEEHHHESNHHHEQENEAVFKVDLVIAGGGPAGLTAAIYAERSGLKTVVIEKAILGGQVATTPVVENYPAFRTVGGKALVDMMAEQAREYADIREGEEVSEIKIGRNIEVITDTAHYKANALIIATGAAHKHLGVPGEALFAGNGVSYCATCDGFLYKSKKIAVIGGGNTALTDALYLKNIGCEVTVIHRRDAFRAEQHLIDSAKREGIAVLWDSVVEEIIGDDTVRGIKIKNIKTGSTSEHAFDGIFVAIGWNPNNELAKMVGLKLDENGYIAVDRTCRTSIPRIYAAGDVTGGMMQIVNATSDGATAAMSAFQDLRNPYWKK